MLRRSAIVMLGVIAAVVLVVYQVESKPSNYGFSVELVEQSRIDPAMNGTLGQPAWYQWLYRVNVNDGEERGYALSHVLVEVKPCFDDQVLAAMSGSSGANRGNNVYGASFAGDKIRYYQKDYGVDGISAVRGVKWEDIPEETVNEELDTIGEYDYFWVSAPTSSATDGVVIIKFGEVETQFGAPVPACPSIPTDPGIEM